MSVGNTYVCTGLLYEAGAAFVTWQLHMKFGWLRTILYHQTTLVDEGNLCQNLEPQKSISSLFVLFVLSWLIYALKLCKLRTIILIRLYSRRLFGIITLFTSENWRHKWPHPNATPLGVCRHIQRYQWALRGLSPLLKEKSSVKQAGSFHCYYYRIFSTMLCTWIM